MTTLHSLVLASSPDGYWPLTETSGTTAADDSGNGRDGTYVGVTLNQTGLDVSQPTVGAAQFAGSPSSYVSIPNLPASGADAFTLMAMAQADTTNTSDNAGIVRFFNSAPTMRLVSVPDGGANAFFESAYGDNGVQIHQQSDFGESGGVVANKHIVFVRFTSAGVMTTWVDGASILSDVFSAHTFATTSTSGSNRIGLDVTSSSGGWNGRIQHVAFWNRALSDTEITDLSTKALVSSPAGMQVVETPDTAAFSMSAINIVMHPAEAADTAAFAMSEITARMQATEASDAASLTFGELADRMQAVEASDTAALSLREVFSLALHPSEASDTAHVVMAVPLFNYMSESVSLADRVTMDVINVIRERVHIADTPSSSLHAIFSVVERAHFADALVIARNLLINESITFAEAVTLKRNLVSTLVEAMVLQDAVSTRLEAVSLLSVALALNESYTAAFGVTLVEALQVDDTVAAKWIGYATAIESVLVTDAPTLTRKAVLALAEPLVVNETLTTSASLVALLYDEVEFEATLVVDGIEFDAWAVNSSSGAPSQYSNFSFDSMCRLGDRYYGAGDAGLFLLDGDDDDGDEIVPSILTGELDFGSPNLKRCDYAHFGVTSSGALVLKVTTTTKGVKREDWYQSVKADGLTTEQRAKIGKGLESQYWQFELLDPTGKEFDLDRMNLRVLELSRRV